MSGKPVVYIVLYSMYGHGLKLAEHVKAGAEKEGAEVKMFQVAETLSQEILDKMHAPKKSDLPVITAAELANADGIIFGAPTRFGTLPAQMKAFLDSCGQLWAKYGFFDFRGALTNKFAGFFTSAATQHGGIETTVLTFLPFCIHLGMMFVPVGYANPNVSIVDNVFGGSPYGASTIAGPDGSHSPTEKELELANFQGSHFAKVVGQFHKGK